MRRISPPPEPLSLERALEFIRSDEYIEVTPHSIRLRKQRLTEDARRKLRVKVR